MSTLIKRRALSMADTVDTLDMPDALNTRDTRDASATRRTCTSTLTALARCLGGAALFGASLYAPLSSAQSIEPSAAQTAAQPTAHRAPTIGADAAIGNGAAAGATGAITVNETAGLDNGQINQITITSGASVANDNASRQATSAAAKLTSARATIGANAFSNTSGAVLVNQSAGAANLQRNSTQLGTAALGIETVSDGELSATAPKNGSLGQSNGVHSVREANISNDAFKNVTGIVQINQTAGAGNTTANSFVLRPPAGTLF